MTPCADPEELTAPSAVPESNAHGCSKNNVNWKILKLFKGFKVKSNAMVQRFNGETMIMKGLGHKPGLSLLPGCLFLAKKWLAEAELGAS